VLYLNTQTASIDELTSKEVDHMIWERTLYQITYFQFIGDVFVVVHGSLCLRRCILTNPLSLQWVPGHNNIEVESNHGTSIL
jgi:hypothetical protein